MIKLLLLIILVTFIHSCGNLTPVETVSGGPSCAESLQIDTMVDYAKRGRELLFADRYDSAGKYLHKSMAIYDALHARGVRVDTINEIYGLHNALGSYYALSRMDFKKSTQYFIEALQIAYDNECWDDYAIITYNLFFNSVIRSDFTNKKYALELYQKGMELNNDKMAHLGAYCMAVQYYIDGDIGRADHFLSKAKTYPIHIIDLPISILQAEIYNSEREFDKAGKYYSSVMDSIDTVSAPLAINHCLSYSKFLIGRGDYGKAMEVVDKGIEIADSKNTVVFQPELYFQKVRIYKSLGLWKEALEAYGIYHDFFVKEYDINKEREIIELFEKYQNEKYHLELRQHKISIRYKNNLLIFMGVAVTLVCALLLRLYAMYRNKDRMYMAIVKKYKQDIDARNPADTSAGQSDKASRHDGIFSSLEILMERDKIYRNADLNRDNVAELLNTNRTYLCQAIKEHAGKSFTQYVNSLRIKESIRILSDINNDTVLKAIPSKVGFNSMATFYRVFKEEVGMSPMSYRDKIIILEKSRNDLCDDD